jgi:prepilin-type N-terminal cleavage/methylation domain-containing protein
MIADLRSHWPADGFTLLEIIVTLVIASLLGTVLFEIMNSALRRSSEPVVMVRQGYELTAIMERIHADYRFLLDADAPSCLGKIKDRVENGNNAAKTPYYGVYTCQTKYISFDGTGHENALPDTVDLNILKVTIRRNDQALTAVLVR